MAFDQPILAIWRREMQLKPRHERTWRDGVRAMGGVLLVFAALVLIDDVQNWRISVLLICGGAAVLMLVRPQGEG